MVKHWFSSETAEPSLVTALKSLNNEFLNIFLALAEGEKDPRNLLIVFAIARVLLIEFDVVNHVEVGHPLTTRFPP